MPRRADDDDDDEDRETPSDAEQRLGDQDEDELDAMPCPYCGKEISERHEVCPHCHSFISRDDVEAARRPAWVMITTIVLILSLLMGIVALR